MRTESQIRILIKKDIRWIVAILGMVVLILLVRFIAFQRYYVSSNSMLPALVGADSGGDHVLVNKLARAHDRWDVVLFEVESEDRPLIKRVVGLPGEAFKIENGEVKIGTKLLEKPLAVQDRLWVPLFNSRRVDRAGFDAFFRREGGELRGRENGWSLEPEGDAEVSLISRGVIRDGVLDGEGRYLEGIHPVYELAVELVVRPTGAGRLEIEIADHDVTNSVSLEIGSRDRGSSVTVGSHSPVPLETGPLPADTSSRIRFAVVDRRVTLRLGERTVASLAMPPRARNPESTSGLINRITVRHRGQPLQIDELKVLRDLYFTNKGRYGVGRPCTIPAGHYFLLGDYSRNSQDSREFGAIPAEDVLGEAIFILWPPGRMGRL